MSIDVFVVECRVELRVDFCTGFVFGCEDYAERDIFVLLLLSFLEQAFWCKDLSIGVFFVPSA
jgi:hypothetical protein